MKKIFPFLLLILITFSCKCEETLTVYTLTDQEKTIVPYVLNDAIKWKDNNNIIYNGSVVKNVVDYSDGGGRGEDCNIIQHNRLINILEINSERYEIVLKKNTSISFYISRYNNEVGQTFYPTVQLNNFSTIEFNGDTYENALLLKESVLDGEPFGYLVYSKTNGIEFILFADGTWYKRVE